MTHRDYDDEDRAAYASECIASHPFSRESIAYELGGDTASDRAWYRWCRKVEQLLGIDDLDGDQATDGYSLDFARDAYEDRLTPAEYAAEVKGGYEPVKS